jgi:hypothetical protein
LQIAVELGAGNTIYLLSEQQRVESCLMKSAAIEKFLADSRRYLNS